MQINRVFERIRPVTVGGSFLDLDWAFATCPTRIRQALHWHSRFLLVDERGAHRAVERKLGLAEPKLVTTLRSDGFEGCNFERFLAGSQQMVEELARP